MNAITERERALQLTAEARERDRMQLFATIDFVVNSVTLVGQYFLSARVANALGLDRTMALLPRSMALSLAVAALATLMHTSLPLNAIAALLVIKRAGNYVLMRPTREHLFAMLPASHKFSAKSVIDAAVYRLGDVASAWMWDGMRRYELTSWAAAMGFVLSGCWCGAATAVSRSFANLAAEKHVSR